MSTRDCLHLFKTGRCLKGVTFQEDFNENVATDSILATQSTPSRILSTRIDHLITVCDQYLLIRGTENLPQMLNTEGEP